MHFEFATSNRILFGQGTVSIVPSLSEELGRRAIIFYNQSVSKHPIFNSLKVSGLNPLPYQVQGEPTIGTIQDAVVAAREGACNIVIGMGGGSTLDTGKVVSILLTNPGTLNDYLEVVGAGRTFKHPSIPYIAIPTTAGTGSEVTRNAVITVPEKQVKVSLRSHYMLPRYAIVDPELSYSMPPEITAYTGLDALTQLIEPFVCNASNPLTDAICREGIPRVARSLLNAYRGQGAESREDMALASLLGGMALANSRLGAIHGLASPIGGTTSAPHGAICARLLPIVLDKNLTALNQLSTRSMALNRYKEIATLLTGDPSANANDAVEWIWDLCKSLNILPLGKFGLDASLFPTIVIASAKS